MTIDAAEIARLRAHAGKWNEAAVFHVPTILSVLDELEKARTERDAAVVERDEVRTDSHDRLAEVIGDRDAAYTLLRKRDSELPDTRAARLDRTLAALQGYLASQGACASFPNAEVHEAYRQLAYLRDQLSIEPCLGDPSLSDLIRRWWRK